MAITTSTLPDGSILTTNTDDATGSVIWTSVAPPPGSPAAVSTANQTTLQQQAQNALTTNRTYLGLASPSTAQNTAQIKALTQQHQALIRLALGQFDATN